MHTSTLKCYFAFIFLSFFLFGPLHAHATIITINFTGKVSSLDGGYTFATDVPVDINDSVSGSWLYDTDATFEVFSSGYWINKPTIGFSFKIQNSTFGELIFEYDSTILGGGNYGHTLFDDYDLFLVYDNDASGLTGPITGTEFISNSTYDPVLRPNWIPDAAEMNFDKILGPPLPDALSNLSFRLGYITWLGSSSTLGQSIGITVESATFSGGTPDPIPEPGTIALLGIGLAGLGLYGYRRRSRA